MYSDEECAKLPLVWQILLHLLSERGESSDMAVNLTAAVSIKECVDVSETMWVMLTSALGARRELLHTLPRADRPGNVSSQANAN